MDTVEWTKTLAISEGDRIGDYIVGSLLGQGGTAAVFRGSYATENGRAVAIKILNPTMLDLEVEKRRLDRQLTLRGHTCPYLIQPIEWFHTSISLSDGTSFPTLVDISEYVDGEPLNSTRLPEDRVRPVIAMISQAARYLEMHGFCHRDIKPDNIIVTKGVRKAVLLDLGVLHAHHSGDDEETPLTRIQTNHALVTRRYSSPEILSGDLRPNSSDPEWLAHTIYQIGALLFEAITERTIFEGRTGDALVSSIIQQNPFEQRPVTRCPDLEAVARMCLSKKPS